MLKSMTIRLFPIVVIAAMIGSLPLDAQFGKLKDKARKAAEKEATKQVENKVRDVVRCAFNDPRCVAEAKKNGQTVVFVDDDGKVVTDENGNPVSDPDEAAKRAQKPGEGVWRNYDFTPGKTVWVATDFTDERVGRFPANQLEFVKGNMQIVEIDGEKVLEIAANSTFRINLPEMLPDDFTLEFYLKTGASNMITRVTFAPLPERKGIRYYDSQYLQIYRHPGVYFQGQGVSTIQYTTLSRQLTPIKLQVDGDYIVLYVGTERAANIPNANIIGSRSIEFQVAGNARLRSYIKDIVVAVGLDELYETLMKSGSFTTRGIYFDFDSDVIRPESTPTLQQILSSLEQHSDLSIQIEGHTDSKGEDDYNQTLSEKRAQAVVDYLGEHGISGDRLGAVGKGETEPVADNNLSQGRAENRRVVIKLVDA